jgi:hypothetical protein
MREIRCGSGGGTHMDEESGRGGEKYRVWSLLGNAS